MIKHSTMKVDKVGNKFWSYNNGEYEILHRTDGPAVEMSNRFYWFVDGTQVESLKEYTNLLNLSDEEMLMIILKYGDIK